MHTIIPQRPQWVRVFSVARGWYALAAALVCLAVYLPALPRDLLPGDASTLMAQHTGLEPFPPLTHLAWGWLAGFFAQLPLGPPAFRWHLFSALCGASACGVLGLLATRLVGTPLDRELVQDHHRATGNLAAVVSALLLGMSLPFRLVATMAHPATFELMVLLVSIYLLVRYLEERKFAQVATSTGLFVLAASQSPAGVILAPGYALALLYALWQHNAFGRRTAWLLMASFAAGLLPILLGAGGLLDAPGFRWTGLQGYAVALSRMVSEWAWQIRFSLPKVAVLTVGLFSVLPLLLLTALPKRDMASFYFLYAACFAIILLLFLNVPLSPWSMFGFRPLLVMPYVLAALSGGILAGAGVGICRVSWPVLSRQRQFPRLPTLLQHAFLLGIAAAITLQAIRNGRDAEWRPATAAARVAEQLVRQLDDGTWLVLDGFMEPLARLKAAEQGKNIRLLGVSRMHHPLYRNLLAGELGDPLLANAARLGLAPLIREMLDPRRPERPLVALFGAPDLLSLFHEDMFPDGVGFISRRPSQNPDEYLQTRQDAWSSIERVLSPAAEKAFHFRDILSRLQWAFGRAANDAGYWLENQDRPELARKAYRDALRMSPENISARLNLKRLLEPSSPEKAALDEEVSKLTSGWREGVRLSDIVNRHGIIHHDAPVRVGPDPALPERALARARDQEALSFMMADLTFTRQGWRLEVELHQALAGIETTNAPVLAGLARLASFGNQPELAQAYLVRARLHGLPEETLLLEQAWVYLEAGQDEKASALLTGMETAGSRDPRRIALLALAAAESRPAESARHLDKLEPLPNLPPRYAIPMARIHLARGDTIRASRCLDQLLRARPFDREALHLLLEIQLGRGNHELVRSLVRQLLSLDARDPRAQHALAQLFQREGLLAEARTAKELSRAGELAPASGGPSSP